MDPVFTLQWPEFLLANRLQKLFPKIKRLFGVDPYLSSGEGV